MIFFDLDGTLIDSNGVWLQVDYDFLGRRGLEITPEYTYTVGHSIFPVAAQFTRDYYHLPDTPEDIMEEWRNLAYHAYAHTIPMKPGAKDLLEKVKADGQDIVLLTAGLPELAKAAITRHHLTPYFKDFFFAQDVGLEKKNPETYRIAAKKFGLSPKDCTLLEDAPYNCAAAREAGMQVIGVYDDFYEASWDKVVENSNLAIKNLNELLSCKWY